MSISTTPPFRVPVPTCMDVQATSCLKLLLMPGWLAPTNGLSTLDVNIELLCNQLVSEAAPAPVKNMRSWSILSNVKSLKGIPSEVATAVKFKNVTWAPRVRSLQL